jgi:heme A synthase
MIDFLLDLHSGWRYVVILMTVLLGLYFLYALRTARTTAQQEKRVLQFWGMVVDLQATLGILLLVSYLLDDRYYNHLTGHWITALIAVLLAHTPAIYQRLNGEPTTQLRRMMGCALPILFLVLVVVALSAIERPLVGS